MGQENNLLDKIMAYYQSGMPYCDKADVEKDVLLGFAKHACFLRNEVEWCKKLPEDIFLEDVAAYRINNERIDDCRRFFYDMVMPLVEGLPFEEAVLKINFWSLANATYHESDDRTANAMTVYKSGFGRCGEESTFLVTVLRSLGIAARQVYVPLWSHCDDNHAWVEVYFDGVWKYLGACEPEDVLNRGWFDLPASRAMLVIARCFGELLSRDENVIIQNDSVTYRNSIEHYAKTARLTVTVTKPDGSLLKNVNLRMEVLNYSYYRPLAAVKTDENGEFCIRLGLGSVRLSCVQEGKLIYSLVTVKEDARLQVTLQEIVPDTWTAYTFYAPEGDSAKAEVPKTPALLEKRERAKEEREARLASYFDPKRAEAFPGAAEILRTAAGNFDEIISFFEKDDNPYRLKMLRALAVKDYYEVKAELLEDHFVHGMRYVGQDGIPDDIFVKYLLNARLELEELSVWRNELETRLGGRRERFIHNPETIWEDICADLEVPVEDAYDTLRLSPLKALDTGRGSNFDKKNLFLAIARTFGIPARLNPVTKDPEYYRDGEFRAAYRKDGQEAASLVLENESGANLYYMDDYTLSYWDGSRYVPLTLDDAPWQDGKLSIEVGTGDYHLVCTTRLQNGCQNAKELYFTLGKEGKQIVFGKPAGDEVVKKAVELPQITLKSETGTETSKPIQTGTETSKPIQTGTETSKPIQTGTKTFKALQNGKKAVCIWLKEGEEPTEHVLNELWDRVEDVRLHKEQIFLISMLQPIPFGTLERLLNGVDGLALYKAYRFADAEAAAAAMDVEGQKYPLAIAADESGKGVFAACGYNVGAVSQLLALL